MMVRPNVSYHTDGITKHAAEQLGDVVFVEVPDVGRKVAAGEACAVVESVKAASDVFAPVSRFTRERAWDASSDNC